MKNVYRLVKENTSDDYYIEVDGNISSEEIMTLAKTINQETPNISIIDCGVMLCNMLKDNPNVDIVGGPVVNFGTQSVLEIDNWIRIEL